MKINDTVPGPSPEASNKNVSTKKKGQKQDLTPSEIKDMVKIKKLEKSGGTKPSLDIKEEKLKQALGDGTVDFNTRDRAVLTEILKP